MNFVPIAPKIDHLRPERQHTSARAYNSGASYGLDCEALCEKSIYCQHSFGASGHAPFLVSEFRLPYSWHNVAHWARCGRGY